jgi:hypothetical protein
MRFRSILHHPLRFRSFVCVLNDCVDEAKEATTTIVSYKMFIARFDRLPVSNTKTMMVMMFVRIKSSRNRSFCILSVR